ncbi:hypothetical protein Tco_1324762 [Tanacetum coccineum]
MLKDDVEKIVEGGDEESYAIESADFVFLNEEDSSTMLEPGSHKENPKRVDDDDDVDEKKDEKNVDDDDDDEEKKDDKKDADDDDNDDHDDHALLRT